MCKNTKGNKMQEDKRNKRKGQPKGQNYQMDKIPKGLFRRDSFRRGFSEGTEKEGEEKNSSSTQAK